MKQYETEHYIFNYNANSKAEKDILKIAALQEDCFAYVCNVLRTRPDFKIEYYLCETPEEVGRIYGDDEPCNGFTSLPNKIYAVYNEKTQCVGFHEDAHVISYSINRPNCTAIGEGLAMYFDRKWWGIHNLDWTGFFLKTNRFIAVDKLLDREIFFSEDCSITYPIMGAFTDWLISSYGIDKYLEFFKDENSIDAFTRVYHKTPKELNQSFTNYVTLFRTDECLEQRMCNLLGDSM